jgi:hypothetical protein
MGTAAPEDAVVLHAAEFLGQGGALDVQVIRELLPVKGDIEFVRSGLQ